MISKIGLIFIHIYLFQTKISNTKINGNQYFLIIS